MSVGKNILFDIRWCVIIVYSNSGWKLCVLVLCGALLWGIHMFLWAFLNKIVPKTAVIRVLHVFVLSVLIISTPMVGFGACKSYETFTFTNQKAYLGYKTDAPGNFSGVYGVYCDSEYCDDGTIVAMGPTGSGKPYYNNGKSYTINALWRCDLGSRDVWKNISADELSDCEFYNLTKLFNLKWPPDKKIDGYFVLNEKTGYDIYEHYESTGAVKAGDLCKAKQQCIEKYVGKRVEGVTNDFCKTAFGGKGVECKVECRKTHGDFVYSVVKCQDGFKPNSNGSKCVDDSDNGSENIFQQLTNSEVETGSDLIDNRPTKCQQSGGTWEDGTCVCEADKLLKTSGDVCDCTDSDETIMTKSEDKCIYTVAAMDCLVSGGNFGKGICNCDANKGLVDDKAGKTCKCKGFYIPEYMTVPGIDGGIIKQCNAPQNQQDCESENARDSGAVWSVDEDRCTCTGMRGNNQINENRYYWDGKSKICVPIVGYEECITKDAKESGAEWSDTERECQCSTQNVANSETATPETYEWILANKKCEPRAGWLNCKAAIGISSSMGQPKWDGESFRCMCMESGYYWPTHETTECQQTDERQLCNSDEAKNSGAVWNESIGKCECSASGSTWNHGRVKCECNNTDYEIQLVGDVYKCVLTDAAKQRQNAESEIEQIAVKLNKVRDSLSVSVWKNKEGNFNTSRLISDGVAAVVLGTAGVVITSNIVKKNQIKYGFEDLKCHIGGQPVAEYGDAFRVR